MIFKTDDLVFIKYICYSRAFGKVVKFDKDKQMYLICLYLDCIDSNSFAYTYVKEEDLDFVSNLLSERETKYYEKISPKVNNLNLSFLRNNLVCLYTPSFSFYKNNIGRMLDFDCVDERFKDYIQKRKYL